MNLRRFLPDWSSIATRLAGWFQLIAVVPCVVLLLVTVYFSRRSLEATVRQRLTVISDAKASQLEAYIAERRNDAGFLANAPGFVDAVERLGALAREGGPAAPGFAAESEKYRGRLVSFAESKAYVNMTLFDLRGVPLVSYRPGLDFGASLDSGPLKGTELADAARRAGALLMPVTSNFQVYPGRKGGHRLRGRPGVPRGGPDRPGRPGTGQHGVVQVGEHLFRPGGDRRRHCRHRGGGWVGLRLADPVRPGRRVPRPDRLRRRQGQGHAARRPGPARVRRDARPYGQVGGHGLDLSPVVPVGPDGQAGRRRGVRPAPPAAAGRRGVHGVGGVGGLRGGPEGVALDHPADPRGRPGWPSGSPRAT